MGHVVNECFIFACSSSFVFPLHYSSSGFMLEKEESISLKFVPLFEIKTQTFENVWRLFEKSVLLHK